MTAADAIAVAAARLRSARRVTVLTGAGVSAASGVPTFRGPDGLWRQYQAADLATPAAFQRDPALVWEWYQWRRARVAACEPNPAHHVLADWSRRDGWTVITQNVDDLHLKAGTRDLIRLHGSLWELSCWTGCPGAPKRWRDERIPLPESLPSCPACGGIARPAVVWFGEALDPDDLDRAIAAAACDVFIAAGTSAIVFPAAGLIDQARREGAFTIDINPDTTPASARVDCVITCGAEDALPALASRLSDR
ncbi:MAG: NAD-dependent deacetylase [Vicinamibacterales bacterium]